jgi:small subunit ribosomal protein S9
MPTKPKTKLAAKTKSTVKKTRKAKPVKEAEVLETPGVPEMTKLYVAEEEMPKEVDVEVKEAEGEEKLEKMPSGTEKYYEAVGRRKEAVARVRVYTKKSTDIQASNDKALIIIGGKPYYEYFRDSRLQNIVDAPLKRLKSMNRFKATVKISGGGARGQADAIRLGLSRALVLFDANFSKKLRKAGFLTHDARVKERRKYGLKKARKAPQWAKR